MPVRRLTLLAVAPLLAVGLALAGAFPSAHASDRGSKRSQATLRVSEGYYPVTADTGPATATSEPCPIAWKARRTMTAMGALEAAKQRGCVSSYVVSETAAGHYLECVSGRCETTGFYWAIYKNRTLTCAGIDDVVLAPGDEVTFSYEAYPTALALATCA